MVLLEVVISQQSLIKTPCGKRGGPVNLSFMTSRKTAQAEIRNRFREGTVAAQSSFRGEGAA